MLASILRECNNSGLDAPLDVALDVPVTLTLGITLTLGLTLILGLTLTQ